MLLLLMHQVANAMQVMACRHQHAHRTHQQLDLDIFNALVTVPSCSQSLAMYPYQEFLGGNCGT